MQFSHCLLGLLGLATVLFVGYDAGKPSDIAMITALLEP